MTRPSSAIVKARAIAKPYPKRERSIGIDAAGTTSRGRCDATRSLQPKAVACA
jgi:hypothetical protein